MLNKYKEVMETADLSDEARRRIVESLYASAASRIPLRRCAVGRVVLVAAVLVMALSCTALAAHSGLFEFLSGGINDGGLATEELTILVRAEEGRVLLTMPEGELDITDLCSESKPYICSFEDGDGAQHYIIAGGTAEQCGFVEYIIDPITGGAEGQGFLGEREEPVTPAWLIAGEIELGIRPTE